MTTKEAESHSTAKLAAPSILGADAVQEIAGALNILLADIFTLYLKTKSFYWHVSGPHFRNYHLMLGDQADRILGTTDTIAERVRELGGTTLGHDNKQLTLHLKQAQDLCDEHGDVATASLLESWIDETEQRTWFLLLAGCAQRAAA